MIYTEDEIIAAVPGLDRTLLVRLVEVRIVMPVERPAAAKPVFAPVDLARLRLACELRESFDLEDDALALVIDLVDRLHAARSDLNALVQAVAALPEPHRDTVARSLDRDGEGGAS